ncbi:hypothetical protein V8F20_003743 [Naviculisporaceae sp. PSN 640]
MMSLFFYLSHARCISGLRIVSIKWRWATNILGLAWSVFCTELWLAGHMIHGLTVLLCSCFFNLGALYMHASTNMAGIKNTQRNVYICIVILLLLCRVRSYSD